MELGDYAYGLLLAIDEARAATWSEAAEKEPLTEAQTAWAAKPLVPGDADVSAVQQDGNTLDVPEAQEPMDYCAGGAQDPEQEQDDDSTASDIDECEGDNGAGALSGKRALEPSAAGCEHDGQNDANDAVSEADDQESEYESEADQDDGGDDSVTGDLDDRLHDAPVWPHADSPRERHRSGEFLFAFRVPPFDQALAQQAARDTPAERRRMPAWVNWHYFPRHEVRRVGLYAAEGVGLTRWSDAQMRQAGDLLIDAMAAVARCAPHHALQWNANLFARVLAAAACFGDCADNVDQQWQQAPPGDALQYAVMCATLAAAKDDAHSARATDAAAAALRPAGESKTARKRRKQREKRRALGAMASAASAVAQQPAQAAAKSPLSTAWTERSAAWWNTGLLPTTGVFGCKCDHERGFARAALLASIDLESQHRDRPEALPQLIASAEYIAQLVSRGAPCLAHLSPCPSADAGAATTAQPARSCVLF
jgi:hypothetical protein